LELLPVLRRAARDVYREKAIVTGQRMTVSVDPEHLRSALEALHELEATPMCAKYKAARKGIAGAMYQAVRRDMDADEMPAFVRRQAT
jgi:hypothetical protein